MGCFIRVTMVTELDPDDVNAPVGIPVRPQKVRILKKVRVKPIVSEANNVIPKSERNEERNYMMPTPPAPVEKPPVATLPKMETRPRAVLNDEEIEQMKVEEDEISDDEPDDTGQSEYDEIDAQVDRVMVEGAVNLTEEQLKDYVFAALEENPHLVGNHIYEHLFAHNVLLDGEPVTLAKVRGMKRSWLHWLEKRNAQVKLAREIQASERELAMNERTEIRTEREKLEAERDRLKKDSTVMYEETKRTRVEREKAEAEARLAEARKALEEERAALEEEKKKLAAQVAPPPAPPAPTPVSPVSPPTTPAVQNPIAVPAVAYGGGGVSADALMHLARRKSNLEVLLERLDKALMDGNSAMAAILLEGVYKEFDKADRATDPAFGLMSELVKSKMTGDGGSGNSVEQMKAMVGIVKELMPSPAPPSEGESDDVAMAKVYGSMVKDISGELKDTALTIAGKKDTSELFGACPYCNETILKDGVVCSFCGGRLRGAPAPGMYAPPPVQPQPYAPPQYPGEGYMQSRYAQQQPFVPQSRVAPQEMPQASPASVTGPERPPVSPEEMKQIVDGMKRVANFIVEKSDPATTVNAFWKLADREQREYLVAAAIIGHDRIQYVARSLAPKFPEVSPYAPILTSNQGSDWLREALEAVKAVARKEAFKVPRDRMASLVATIEQRIGMEIPTEVPA